jgi:hypothetical protein
MTTKDFKSLETGDIIRHVTGGDTFIVSANYGDCVIATKTINASNPSEWILKAKAEYTIPEDK